MWDDVVEHLLAQRSGDVEQLLLRHPKVPVSPVARPCLAKRPRQGFDKQSCGVDASSGCARGYPRRHAHLEREGTLTHLPLLIAYACLEGMSLAVRKRLAPGVDQVVPHALRDLVLGPADGRARDGGCRDRLEGLEPRGARRHLSEVRDPIMRRQLREIDALEEGQGVTVDASLDCRAQQVLIAIPGDDGRWCQCGVHRVVGGRGGDGRCGVHDLTLRRRSDSESSS